MSRKYFFYGYFEKNLKKFTKRRSILKKINRFSFFPIQFEKMSISLLVYSHQNRDVTHVIHFSNKIFSFLIIVVPKLFKSFLVFFFFFVFTVFGVCHQRMQIVRNLTILQCPQKFQANPF